MKSLIFLGGVVVGLVAGIEFAKEVRGRIVAVVDGDCLEFKPQEGHHNGTDYIERPIFLDPSKHS